MAKEKVENFSKDITNATTEDNLVSYVCKNGKYYRQAPKKHQYCVRHPTPHSAACITSSDTRDLVIQLGKIYHIKVRKD